MSKISQNLSSNIINLKRSFIWFISSKFVESSFADNAAVAIEWYQYGTSPL